MRLTSLLLLLLGVCVPVASAQTPQGTTRNGESLYAERCAKCHESGVPRAANREAMAPVAGRRPTGADHRQHAHAGSWTTPAQIDSLAFAVLGTGLRPRLPHQSTAVARRALRPRLRMRSIGPGGTGGAPISRSTDSSRPTRRACRPIRFRG